MRQVPCIRQLAALRGPHAQSLATCRLNLRRRAARLRISSTWPPRAGYRSTSSSSFPAHQRPADWSTPGKPNTPTAVIDRRQFDSDKAYGDAIFAACRDADVDYVAMAGFLKLAPVPDDFVGRVLNIHPALIPAFCGPGMYGRHVHQAVLDQGVKVTGVTVHFVDNEYDHGPIIWQQPVPVFDDDTAQTLAERVFAVEKEAYPHVLRLLAGDRIHVKNGQVSITAGGRTSGAMPPD